MKSNYFLSIRRLVVTLVVLQLGFLVLIGKLFTIQIPNADETLASRKESRKDWRSNANRAVKRGKILDRHGYVLSISQDTIAVCADPKTFNRKSNAHTVAAELAPILDTPRQELLKQLKRERNGEYVEFVWLKKDIKYEKLDEIREITRKHRGLRVEIEPKRVYPNDTLASQVIGYLNDLKVGEGIEYQYDNYLQRVHRPIHDRNRQLTSMSLSTQKLGNNGCNVVLTLDQVIQDIAEKEIAQGCKDWNALKGTAIVLVVDTSEILAMASYPSYDVNDQTNADEEAKRNLGIWYLFEPGSIFKIIATSAVLNEKIMTPESTVFCENGRYRLTNRRVIKDVSSKGWLSLTSVIQKSSNIGMIKIVQQLGPSLLQTYVDDFGFGAKTGVDLPYEKSGSLYALRHWDVNSLGSVPFGQGISVTPLQMVNALAAIANGGTLHQPYITKEIRDAHGNLVKKNNPIALRRVLQPFTARQMTEILIGVVEQGSGTRAKIEGTKVAGKTGTAQKAEKGKGYAAGKEVMSFIGFLPADDPKIAIIVTLDEPKGARFSGTIAGPVFKRIAEQTLKHTKQTGFFDSKQQRQKVTPRNVVDAKTNRTLKDTTFTTKIGEENKNRSNDQTRSLIRKTDTNSENVIVQTGVGL